MIFLNSFWKLFDTHYRGPPLVWSPLKVSKFQNENMKSSHCPKYERKKSEKFCPKYSGQKFSKFLFIFWAM